MSKNIDVYNKKRDFTKTGEPPADDGKGKAGGSAGSTTGSITGSSDGNKSGKSVLRLKFVVQHHMARREHYDLRLEWGGVLLSWAVPKGPSFYTGDKRLAIHVEDHPISYKDFEGTIPKGQYGGGTVMVWDTGTWEPRGDAEQGLASGNLKFTLKGKRLKGNWALIRINSKNDKGGGLTSGDTKNGSSYTSSGDNWLLLKEKDNYAKDNDGISEFITSIKTGRTMQQITDGVSKKSTANPMQNADMQLAKLTASLPEGDNWLYEIKYDGYRIAAYADSSGVKLITRNGNDYTDKFNRIASSIWEWAAGRAMILDGEMVIADDSGKSNFQALQNYIKNPDDKNLIYIVFDILALDGEDLRTKKLLYRKQVLKKLLQNAPPDICISRTFSGSGRQVLDAVCRLGLEGVIGKRTDSEYLGKRDGSWIKLKCQKTQQFFIGGYTISGINTSGVSSLLLGQYTDGEFIYCGRSGTGMSRTVAAELHSKFDKIKTDKPPFKNPPAQRADESIIWLKPALCANITFAEWTNDNVLRHASFKGLCDGKHGKSNAAGAKGAKPAAEKANKPNKNSPKNTNTKKESGNGKMDTNNKKSIKADSDKTAAKSDKTARSVNKTAAKSDKTAKSVNDTSAKSGSKSAVKSEKKDSAADKVIVSGITITSPEKVMFKNPEVKKIEIIEYYKKVARRMLPYVGNRILSIVRCPKGITGECFYKKNAGQSGKAVQPVEISSSGGDIKNYFYIEDTAGLITEAQMCTLEFHVWGSRIDNLEKPDIMVFDLDPDEGMGLDRVRQGVRDIKQILDGLSLKSFLKTSGGKGYHVVVPFKPSADWQTFYAFAKRIAEIMQANWPDRYTSNMRKVRRKDRIFIDWVRNGRGATSVAPYSLRAREGAAVSMPISWRELDTVAPADVDMGEAVKRLSKSDPWKNFYKTNQEITAQIQQ